MARFLPDIPWLVALAEQKLANLQRNRRQKREVPETDPSRSGGAWPRTRNELWQRAKTLEHPVISADTSPPKGAVPTGERPRPYVPRRRLQ